MKIVAMTKLKAGDRNIVRRAVGLLAALCAATFLLAVLLHLDVRIPLGFAVLDEPPRPFAVIVEGVAGLLLALGAFAILRRKTWAWAAATWGYAVALAGVMWGMVAVAAGRGPHTQLNDTFHRVMAMLLAAGLLLLLTTLGRASLGRKSEAMNDGLGAICPNDPDRGAHDEAGGVGSSGRPCSPGGPSG